MDLIATEPIGWFRATTLRDGVARGWDGSPIFALNRLSSSTEEIIVEIQFGDGAWMLATTDDVYLFGAEGNSIHEA